MPTIDCAVLIAAQELGCFARRGLRVRLSREVGWASIRERLLHEELDAAHAHASMAFSIYCGIGVIRRPCLTAMVLASNCSAITLSNEMWSLGVRDAATMSRVALSLKGERTFKFGVVLGHSSQNYNLRKWLASGGLDPDRDVATIVIPSPLVYQTMCEGHLDGYCVAEPWNSAAVFERTGWVVAATAEIEPGHPDKILLVLQDFATRRETEHLQMIAALVEASEFCQDQSNGRELARILAAPRYLDLDEKLLTNCLLGPFDTGRGPRDVKNFTVFGGGEANRPTRRKARWVMDSMRALLREPCTALRPDIIPKVFRDDIFRRANALVCREPSIHAGEADLEPVPDETAITA